MINPSHLIELSKKLASILKSELALGNEIAETSKGWPDDSSIAVFLMKPFIGRYQDENIEFTELNDPHYWKAEYFDKASRHLLACRF